MSRRIHVLTDAVANQIAAGEAHAGTWRAIQEAFRIPEPRRPFQLRIRKRAPDQTFREVWSIRIDPASRFVDRAPLPEAEAKELEKLQASHVLTGSVNWRQEGVPVGADDQEWKAVIHLRNGEVVEK